jgi:hypothetical protein
MQYLMIINTFNNKHLIKAARNQHGYCGTTETEEVVSRYAVLAATGGVAVVGLVLLLSVCACSRSSLLPLLLRNNMQHVVKSALTYVSTLHFIQSPYI